MCRMLVVRTVTNLGEGSLRPAPFEYVSATHSQRHLSKHFVLHTLIQIEFQVELRFYKFINTPVPEIASQFLRRKSRSFYAGSCI